MSAVSLACRAFFHETWSGRLCRKEKMFSGAVYLCRTLREILKKVMGDCEEPQEHITCKIWISSDCIQAQKRSTKTLTIAFECMGKCDVLGSWV